MPTFEASRMSGNDNAVFPDKLEIDATSVTYFKGTLIGYRKTVIARSNIASAQIRSGLFFANIIIESTGGLLVKAEGFRNKDARTIAALLS